MVVQHLFQPFEIEFLELDVCPVREHRNTFLEIIYISKGSGTQTVNQNTLGYYPDNLFLLMPQDVHFFTITTTTSFLFIRFNNIYLEAHRQAGGQLSQGDWIKKMEFIFQNTAHRPGCILREQNDKPLVRSLMDAILREHINQKPYHRELIQQLVNTVITLVARNIAISLPESEREGSWNAMDMLNYIHQNIYAAEKLKAQNLATHFNISTNYISEYFKKQTGETLQQYITNYKLKLVESRLLYSDMRMNEIVSELNFTDESHLNRIFKKYRGVSPSVFRKQHASR